MDKINGLDLFSGIGGLTKALEEWVRPVAYCENDRYAQGVLLSRMSEGKLPVASIWDNVATLLGKWIGEVDIIYGGFPCQDISVANTNGKGLDGKRSGLFFEIERLVREIRPRFVFLENVPAIRTRGADIVAARLADAGYDCRWITLSASEVGANHKRKRWWMLAHARRKPTGSESIGSNREQFDSKTEGIRAKTGNGSTDSREDVAHAQGKQSRVEAKRKGREDSGRRSEKVADVPDTYGNREKRNKPEDRRRGRIVEDSWWAIEPNVGRVVNELPFRLDRLKGLGNAVVPAQAKEAFKILMGFKGET